MATRRDFAAIASAMLGTKPGTKSILQWKADCVALAQAGKRLNIGFRRSVFLLACGWSPEEVDALLQDT